MLWLLTISHYDELTSRWVPLSSTVSLVDKTITATLSGEAFFAATYALSDNPGLRLPFLSQLSSRIQIEESMDYRTPTEADNESTEEEYRYFYQYFLLHPPPGPPLSPCGGDLNCMAHFPDSDRNPDHHALDFVDVQGGTFTVYAGVNGTIEITKNIGIDYKADEPWFASIAIKAVVKGRTVRIRYKHIVPNANLEEGDAVTPSTVVGHTYKNSDSIWGQGIQIEGFASIQGYCRILNPKTYEFSHPFHDDIARRCYPAHVDFTILDPTNSKFIDPFDLCQRLPVNGDPYQYPDGINRCKAYYYPSNRFRNDLVSEYTVGVNQLWFLQNDNMVAVDAPDPDLGYPSSTIATILNGYSHPTIDENAVNVQVCGNNLAKDKDTVYRNGTVYWQMWRGATGAYGPRTWNGKAIVGDNETCVTIQEMDGVGQTLENVTYYTVVAIEQMGPNEAAQQRTSCYASTSGTRLCDSVRRSTTTNPAYIPNGYSHPTIDTNAVNLQACGDNLSGKTVYWQMWRGATGGLGARTWNGNGVAGSNCITFTDLDGSGDTLAGVTYYTVAAIEPIGATEAAQQRTSCYADTGGTRLCDGTSRANPAYIPNGYSHPTIDTNAVNLQACGDNLSGKTVYWQMWRGATGELGARTWNGNGVAGSNCITFTDLDGSGDTLAGVTYYTVAAIEPLGATEAAQQRTSCYDATGGTRLCDGISRTNSAYIPNGYSHPTIDTNAVNLQACGDNLSGKTVYWQMWRGATGGLGARTWNGNGVAGSNCITFTDLDGSGDTLAGVTYYTVAAIEPIGATEAAQQRTSCYADTGGTRLCDGISRTNSAYIPNGYSHPTIDTNAVNLQACGDNLSGKTVYWQMWRGATGGLGARTWNGNGVAGSNCITFTDLDGSGGTLAGVTYYTVAAIEPIGATEAAQQRTSCYDATGGTRLCDGISR